MVVQLETYGLEFVSRDLLKSYERGLYEHCALDSGDHWGGMIAERCTHQQIFPRCHFPEARLGIVFPVAGQIGAHNINNPEVGGLVYARRSMHMNWDSREGV